MLRVFFVFAADKRVAVSHSHQMTDYIDFAQLERPASPNTYLVAPEGLCQNAEADAAPPELNKSPRGLFSTLSELIAKERRWVSVETDAEQMRFKFVAKTPLIGFKDDVDILIIPTGDTATLAIYSRSRVGYSDMGANRKRVSKLLQDLTTN